ncbi:DUF3078 domain-containing protein [Salmonirosea aquatica]|uniref:DUF3078 domain-containing protein n=1 Tax=Salmonirosea aquatica TaxID=2654236 RepID=A0A7C9FCN0_9BACT|nr:DUF3078 domain-containing protein [Cytophagaceae bacterium SJW1-29]
MKWSYIFLVITAILNSFPAFSQDEILIDSVRNELAVDTSWKKKVEFGANLNQGSFSSNWTGGAVNSIAVGVHLNAVLTYEKDRNSWRNDFQGQYGIVRNKGQESRKSVDRLFFDTKYGRELTEHWSMIASLNFLSQFAPGYDYDELPTGELVRRKVSGLFSPAYLTEAVGIEYQPADYFFLTFSPGAIRQTIVSDLNLYKTFPKNYGVPIGQRVRTEVALMQLIANFDKKIAKNLNLKFRYQLFANYKDLGAVDHRLDASFTAKINKYWNVNLGAILIYDQDQSLDVQLAQSLSIGFLYTF